MSDRPVSSNERVSDEYLATTLASISNARALDSQMISTTFFRKLLVELIERRASETPAPQAPIAKLIVREDGRHEAVLYAPGLPLGKHDVYCEPESTAPYIASKETAMQRCCGCDCDGSTSRIRHCHEEAKRNALNGFGDV